MIKKIALAIMLSGVALIGARAQVIASDDFESGTIGYGSTTGSGFGPLSYIKGSGGGVFADNSGTDNSQIDGNQSLGIFAGTSGGNTQAAGLAINTPVTNGVYSVDAKFNVSNSVAFSGLNITTGIGSLFGSNELLSFGLVPGNNGQFLITDGTGTHDVSVVGDTELRGGTFNFTVDFNTVADTYTLTVTDKGTPSNTGSISGSLEGVSPGAVAAIGFGNFNTGNNQNLIVDNLSISEVPEPGTWLAAGMAVAGCLFLRRRRIA